MPNYYEILNVSPEADVAEIQAVYEQQYNHWRRLVTHHDPDTVNKANLALRWLEKIKATLTDLTQREAYDASIGLGGPVGGLTDPTARPPVVMAPPPPKTQGRAAPQAVPVAERVDAWVCPKCQAANAVGTRFCERCGETLGQECPNCTSWIKAQAVFCPECGINVPELRQQQEQERKKKTCIQQQIIELQGHVNHLLAQKQDSYVSGLIALRQASLLIGGVSSVILSITLSVLLWDDIARVLPMVLCFLLVGISCIVSYAMLENRTNAKYKLIRVRNKQLDEGATKLQAEIQQLQSQLDG